MTPVRRIQGNLLATGERRLLTWICQRLPVWVTPDQLTALGFVGAIMVFFGYALSTFDREYLWLAILGYGVHWFGDSLDGSLARFRSIERPGFGYFIDHSIDALANLIALTGLGLSAFVRLDVALLGLISYLLLSIHAFLKARVLGELKLSYLAGGPTELRLLLIAMTLGMLFFGPHTVLPGRWSIYDLMIGGLATILLLIFIGHTIVTARQLRAMGG